MGRCNYGKYFAEMLTDNARKAIDTGRILNPGAPAAFGENHLRRQVRSYIPPSNWPKLLIEKAVADDVIQVNERAGGIDYLFVSKSQKEEIPSLDNVLATMELKGPTRPALLRGSRCNWYPAIVTDLRKQFCRAIAAPDVQHYLGLLLVPSKVNMDVREEFYRVLDEMKSEASRDIAGECNLIEKEWHNEGLDGINLLLLQVVPQ